MLDNYSQIVSSTDPEVILHCFNVGKNVCYAIDSYRPVINNDMGTFEKIVAYETAMGYKLRLCGDKDESWSITPRPVNTGAILELIKKHASKIKESSHPLIFGFCFDAAPPIEGSKKALNTLVKECACSRIRTMISTAYTPSNELRKVLMESDGLSMIEIRIPAILGIETPSIEQIAYITRRLHHYANGTAYTLRFGPIVSLGKNKSSVEIKSFWDNIMNSGVSIRIDSYIGSKLFCPGSPVIPQGYLELLEKTRTLPDISSTSFDTSILMTIASLASIGRSIEIYNHPLSQDTDWSVPIFGETLQRHRSQTASPYLDSKSYVATTVPVSLSEQLPSEVYETGIITNEPIQ